MKNWYLNSNNKTQSPHQNKPEPRIKQTQSSKEEIFFFREMYFCSDLMKTRRFCEEYFSVKEHFLLENNFDFFFSPSS